MIILPSRNGMLLRNSNGILAADCGGPVEFSCPCTLLTGDNSDCYDTDCTPSTYIVTTTDESYCLDYVSGSTWQKTIGSKVITLSLESASETASVTIVDGGTTVFSGTNTGTSCIHRWTGSMSNAITPDTIGDVSYSTDCEQPANDCNCTSLSGDNCGAFDTNETPSTYSVTFGNSGSYCLDYVEECIWATSVGSLDITLNIAATQTSSSLVVKDNGVTVFSGTYNGTSGIHRWEGSMDNTIVGSDWGSASYSTDCEQTTYIDCELGCSLTTGCSCFPTGDTPTKYFVVLPEILLCLDCVSDCEWSVSYGDLTATLEIGTISTLTITDGGVTVFEGSTVLSTVCQKGGDIENTIENDWTTAYFYPGCSDYSCLDGRLLKFEILDMSGLVIAAAGSSTENYIKLKDNIVFYGYTTGGVSSCGFFVNAGAFLERYDYRKMPCSKVTLPDAYIYFNFSINPTTGVFNFTADMDYGWEIMKITNQTLNWNSMAYGAYEDYDNEWLAGTSQVSPNPPTCDTWDYINYSLGAGIVILPGTLRITVF